MPLTTVSGMHVTGRLKLSDPPSEGTPRRVTQLSQYGGNLTIVLEVQFHGFHAFFTRDTDILLFGPGFCPHTLLGHFVPALTTSYESTVLTGWISSCENITNRHPSDQSLLYAHSMFR